MSNLLKFLQGNRVFVAVFLALTLATSSGCAAAVSQVRSASSESLYNAVKSRGTLRVGVRPDDPPHSFLNGQGKLVGFDVDIAAAIARYWHVKLQLVIVNELTRISYLQNGRIDLAVTSISKTVRRAEQIDFSGTYFYSDQTILVRKGKYHHLSDLAGQAIAVDRGSNAGNSWLAWLKAHGHPGDTHVEDFGDKQASLNAVKQGAVAGWAEDYELLAAYARKDPSLSIIQDPGGVGVKLDGVGMHKNDSALMLEVNLALQRITSSGAYDKIYNQWFGPHSATPVPRMGSIEVWPNG
jgi:polar amino acid transport system substrate-binding protein